MLSNNTNKSNQYITIIVFVTKVRMYGGGCVEGWYSIGIMLYVSRIAMNRFQCIWVAMIGEMYKLIVEYLENGFR